MVILGALGAPKPNDRVVSLRDMSRDPQEYYSQSTAQLYHKQRYLRLKLKLKVFTHFRDVC